MKERLLLRSILLIADALVTCGIGFFAEQNCVHAVVDLGHRFTFYADGRFHRQYLPGQPAVTSWGALFNFDFSNANLLILLGCDPHLEYVRKDMEVINQFLQQGGGVVLLGAVRDESQGTLASQFGCSFGKP